MYRHNILKRELTRRALYYTYSVTSLRDDECEASTCKPIQKLDPTCYYPTPISLSLHVRNGSIGIPQTIKTLTTSVSKENHKVRAEGTIDWTTVALKFKFQLFLKLTITLVAHICVQPLTTLSDTLFDLFLRTIRTCVRNTYNRYLTITN